MKAARDYPILTVTAKGTRWLESGHPWVYDSDVAREPDESECENGALVDVVSEKGKYLGTGFLSRLSKLRVRIVSRNANDRFDENFWRRRVRYAWDYRKAVMDGQTGCCRLISAQSLGCYPINRAIQEDKPWEPMEENTIADSISVGVPRNADKALAAIRESNGIAVNVSDEEILAAQRLLGRTCGVFGEPAGVTGAAALKKACEEGLIPHDATVVSVVTGNGLKDVANAIKSAGEPIHIAPDLDLMVEEFKKRGVTVE